MTYKEIVDLVKLVNKTDLSEIKVENGDFKISIRTKEFYSGKGQRLELPGQAIGYQTMAPTPQAEAPLTAPAPAESSATGEVKADESDSSANLIEVKSPIVGTFYRSSSPDKPAYVKVGDTIEPGSVVCIVEAMKLFNEIESEVSGKIVKVMLEDASPVEYDQVLYLVDPS